jgi:hypothetical protein
MKDLPFLNVIWCDLICSVYFPTLICLSVSFILTYVPFYACSFSCHLDSYVLSCLPIFLPFRPICSVIPAFFLPFAPLCPVMPVFFLLFAPLCPVMPVFFLPFKLTCFVIPIFCLPFYLICSPISVCFWPFTCVTPFPLFLYAFLGCRCKIGFRD